MLKNDKQIEQDVHVPLSTVAELLQSAGSGCRLCDMASALLKAKMAATTGLEHDAFSSSSSKIVIGFGLISEEGMVICAPFPSRGCIIVEQLRL